MGEPQAMTRLLVLFVTAFVDMVGLTMIIPLLPFYATELGGSATVVGLLVSACRVVL
jgi:predicted MFS family arabinose efflux permease